MTQKLLKSRRGVSLPEMLVGLVVVAIVGLGITKMITSQARFFSTQSASRDARNVSRSTMNRIISDLRMVEASGGVVSASATAVVVRVPYALGVSCDQSVLSLLPADSAQYASGVSGYAWRNVLTGVMSYVEASVTVSTSASIACTTAGIGVLTSDGGKLVAVSPALPVAAIRGTPVLLYRRVRYEFKTSSAIPTGIGLFRQALSPDSAEQEVATPFESGAKFRFFIGNSATAQDNAPSDLSTIRGFELNLTGVSERAVAGDVASKKEAVVTAIFFKNRTT
ncbi:MAG: prepilin-type N-terminal cleavage/methylation domain-containing protein [Gemmatimonadaceae bacterium]|nr:prepilin-type N-terminal cleavage/methylation domain-containing protein [Gemmatimonadaceae bacterium]